MTRLEKRKSNELNPKTKNKLTGRSQAINICRIDLMLNLNSTDGANTEGMTKEKRYGFNIPKNAAKKPRFDLVRKLIFLSSKSSKAIASHTDAPTLRRASLQVIGEFVSATNKHHQDQPRR